MPGGNVAICRGVPMRSVAPELWFTTDGANFTPFHESYGRHSAYLHVTLVVAWRSHDSG